MKSKLFIAVIITAIIVVIYFAVKKSPAQAPVIQEKTQTQNSAPELSFEENLKMPNMASDQSSSVEKNSKVTVNYTDSGFSPSLVEIKKGETVRFVNQSHGGMDVGSGPHPTHTAYPEFDAKKSVPNGGIYEFTFARIGKWNYHNHVSPGKTGAVIVK